MDRFLENGPLKTQMLASLYRLPPAGRFFEKWTLKTQVWASLYRLPPAGRFFEKMTSKKHKSSRRCTGGLRRLYFLQIGSLFWEVLFGTEINSRANPATFLEALIPHQVQKRAHPLDPEGGGGGY